jgi:MSHA pilin protein MshC
MVMAVSRLKTVRRLDGFTLVELIVVLLLVSILAVVGLSRFTDQSAFSEWGFTGEVATALRYAQKLAMSSGCDTALTVNAGGYQLRQRAGCKSGGFDISVLLPGGTGDYAGNTPGGTAVSALNLYFDPTGRPHDMGTGLLLTLVSSISIGAGSILIEPETGFVHRP